MNKFRITFFGGPSAEYADRPEIISDMKKSGIDLAQVWYPTVEKNRSVVRELGNQGIEATVFDPRIRGLYDSNAGSDEVDSVVKMIVDDYKDLDNIIGWELADEPSKSNFPVLARLVSAFKKYSPECETTINLFPNYATPEQTGSTDYKTHLEEFIDTVKPSYISYDHYSFMGREGRKKTEISCGAEENERERLIRLSAETTEDRGGFFQNIEDVRSAAIKHGLDSMLIVLLTEHGPYRNLTREEIRWEVNMCLAYGMKRLSYFTYWRPSDCNEFWQWDNAMCDVDGSKTRHYYDVKQINSDIRAAGEYLFGRKSAAVFHIGGNEKGTKEFTSYGGINEIKSDRHIVIGFFDDGSAYLVNGDYINDADVTIATDGREFTVTGRDGTNCLGGSIHIDAGDAVLLIPADRR